MLSRRGTTLAELLVALVLGAIVLASATGTLLRMQRTTSGMVSAGQATAQVRAGTVLLSAELSALAPSSADIVEARDTALQARTAVVAGLACDGQAVTTLAADGASLSSAGVAGTPRAGDSLWWYQADSLRWIGRLVADAWGDTVRCAGAEQAGDPPAARRVVRLRLDAADVVPALAPVRVTRQVRLALYRSGDGTWQFGLREWNAAGGGFTGPQPAAGPFERVAGDGRRTGFRYFDAGGATLAPDADGAAIARIARIRVTALALQSAGSASFLGAAPSDSADIAIRASSLP